MNTPLLWQPSASINTLKQRAQCMKAIRHFFEKRGYWEVETPIMARHGVTDVYLDNISARALGKNYYLQTSPEYHMKRLLAAGSGPIFQLSRVFRDDEHGQWHNPEFTLLEWYKLDVNHHFMMDETGEFLQQWLNCPPLKKYCYNDVMEQLCGVDISVANVKSLQGALVKHHLENVIPADESDIDQYLFLLMSHVVQPALHKEPAPIAVYNFPPSQASLARVVDEGAERFEIFYRGIELANGFHELTDASEQQARFEADNKARLARGLSLRDIDSYLLAAIRHGLPSCSGVALGVDRLLAFALGQSCVANTIAFDVERA